MTLVNYDDDLDLGTSVTVTQPAAPVIVERVVVRQIPSATHLLKSESDWGWEEVRDYVVRAIEQAHGPFPRNSKTEHSIFKGFVKRWGSQAGPIARFVFEQTGGMWKGAPVSVNRFCQASDKYFAQPISERL